MKSNESNVGRITFFWDENDRSSSVYLTMLFHQPKELCISSRGINNTQCDLLLLGDKDSGYRP